MIKYTLNFAIRKMVTMILLELLRHLLHSFGLEGMCNHLHSSPDTRDYRITLVLSPILEKTAYLKVNNLWDHSTTNENQRVISTTKDNWGHCGNNYISIKKLQRPSITTKCLCFFVYYQVQNAWNYLSLLLLTMINLTVYN